jgi:microcystin-dependent protein
MWMEQYIGQILMVAFNFAPVGWALCNGQLLPIAQNTALFSLLGTTYGGDGVRTFGLPNLQSRVPVHQGQGTGLSPYVMGQIGGAESAMLTISNLPAHNHPANCSNTPGPNSNPTGNYWSEVNDGAKDPALSPSYATSVTGQMGPQAIGLTGGNQPVPVLPPYQVVNFIIALQGVFPSRS